MKCNVGKVDRVIRVLLGFGIVAAGISLQSWWGAMGVVPILTATLGWCPVYVPLGVSSCKK